MGRVSPTVPTEAASTWAGLCDDIELALVPLPFGAALLGQGVSYNWTIMLRNPGRWEGNSNGFWSFEAGFCYLALTGTELGM